ncbi:MAG TPA: hypothetical protein VFO25_03315 [Candidatus Eremiobacteraceae bacterium]|nr:hypothetical protein [Candidatus Eremiobacteraceae bacterium]
MTAFLSEFIRVALQRIALTRRTRRARAKERCMKIERVFHEPRLSRYRVGRPTEEHAIRLPKEVDDDEFGAVRDVDR